MHNYDRMYIITSRSGGKTWMQEAMYDLLKTEEKFRDSLSNKLDENEFKRTYLGEPLKPVVAQIAERMSKEMDAKILNNIRILCEGKLYAPSNITVSQPPLARLPKIEIEFVPSICNERGLYSGLSSVVNPPVKNTVLDIQKVIFNPPATTVIWGDNTKTVVKCQENECFDPEKGLALAIAKKTLGNQGNYYNTIRKFVQDVDNYFGKKEKPAKKKTESAEPVAVETEEGVVE